MRLLSLLMILEEARAALVIKKYNCKEVAYETKTYQKTFNV